MKKYIISISLMIIFLLLMTACGGADGASGDNDEKQSNNGEYPEMTIKFSHNQPLTSPEHTGAKKFKKVVEDKSNGNITVEIYGESQLGSLREQVESTQIGEIDITMQPPAAVTPFVDDIKIVDLPYLWPTDAEKMYSVMDGKAGKALLDTLGNGGFKGLGFWPGGYKLFTTKDTEIHSPEDLEGLKMRTMASPVLINQYEHWGGNAIPVPYGEVYNSLQQGIVDGQENPLQTIYSQKYYEVQNHVIESKHGPMSYLLMTNQSWFKGLDDNVQSLIVDAEKKGRTAAREAIKEKEDEFRENIKDSGVNYYELTDEEIEKFKEKSKPYWEKALDTSKQMELLDKVKKAVQNVE